MIVVFPFSTVDQDLALKNAQWMNELGGCHGHEVVCYDARCTPATVEAIGQEMLKCFDKVFRLVAKAEIDGWPEGANYFFRLATAYLQDKPLPYFFWMEPDAVPLQANWLNMLVAEHAQSGKPFMGDRVAVEDIPVHMSGIGIYPNPLHALAGEAYRAHEVAFDMAGKDQIIPKAHFTKQIEHAWKHPKFTSIDELRTQIRPEAVLFHASKDGSLIDILREQKKPAVSQSSVPLGTSQEGVPTSASSGGREISCDIFIRTYPGDYGWLYECLRAIKKFAFGFRKIWVVSPEPNALGPWMSEINWKQMNDESEDGYLAQQITKMYADVITDYAADHILHVDSDVILTRPVTPQDFFVGNKLVMPYTPYSLIETPWQAITEKFMDRPVENEFMRRFPIMLPRWLYPRVREFCFKKHRVSLGDYVKMQPLRAFSEFNAMGAYAWQFHHDMFHWVDTHADGSMAEPFGKQYHSWSGLTPEIKAEIDSFLRDGAAVARLAHNQKVEGSIPSPAIRILPNGIWVIAEDTHISKWIEEQGRLDHDQNTLPFILPHLNPGDVVVDAGAFVGDHTIAYSKAVGSAGVVHAFEPNPVAYQCLFNNMRTCGNVVMYEVGLSDKQESVPISGNNNNYGGCYAGEHMKLADVTVQTLDQHFNGTQVNFIKLDIEGMEVKALRGAEKLITRCRPKMVIEVNQVALERQGVDQSGIFSFLREHHYDWKIVQENCDENSPMYDIICFPRNQPPVVLIKEDTVGAPSVSSTPVAAISSPQIMREYVDRLKEFSEASSHNKMLVMQRLSVKGLKVKWSKPNKKNERIPTAVIPKKPPKTSSKDADPAPPAGKHA